MIGEERRALLIQKITQDGYIEISEEASEFDVTGATLRRDLIALEEEGLCTRVRGGAIRRSQGVTHEVPYDLKRRQFLEEKTLIGKKAAEFVQPGDTIIIDAGSTTYALAQALLGMKGITVVTNDLHISVRLASNPDINLICTGGRTRAHVYSLEGAHAEEFISDLHVDKTFLGADAVHKDFSVFNVNMEEVPIKQAMIESAKQVFLLTDSSKFEKTGFAKVCAPADINFLITDEGVDEDLINQCDQHGIDLRIVS